MVSFGPSRRRAGDLAGNPARREGESNPHRFRDVNQMKYPASAHRRDHRSEARSGRCAGWESNPHAAGALVSETSAYSSFSPPALGERTRELSFAAALPLSYAPMSGGGRFRTDDMKYATNSPRVHSCDRGDSNSLFRHGGPACASLTLRSLESDPGTRAAPAHCPALATADRVRSSRNLHIGSDRCRTRIRTPTSWFRARRAATYTIRHRRGRRRSRTLCREAGPAFETGWTPPSAIFRVSRERPWDRKESNPARRGKSPLHRRQCFGPERTARGPLRGRIVGALPLSYTRRWRDSNPRPPA